MGRAMFRNSAQTIDIACILEMLNHPHCAATNYWFRPTCKAIPSRLLREWRMLHANIGPWRCHHAGAGGGARVGRQGKLGILSIGAGSAAGLWRAGIRADHAVLHLR